MSNKLKLGQIFSYGLPGLPLAMLGLPLFVYLPSFYSQNLGLSLAAVGFALLLARSLDVITDPLIGLMNDRFPESKSIIWRRKSYIIIGLPLLLIGLNFLLKPSADATASYLFIWSFITYIGWTLINIPWLAMGAEITNDYHEKSALASSREIFAVVGTVSVISLPVILSIQENLKATLEILATVLTLLLPLSLLPLLFKINTERYITTLDKKKNSQNSKKVSLKKFRQSLFTIIKYPAIKRLLPAYFVNSIANALPATLFILFVTYVLQTPQQVGILLISYFLSAIVGIPLWLYIAKKTDKHISWSIALAGAIAGFIWVPFLNIGDFIPFLIVCLVSGFCLGADVVMPASIQADIAQSIGYDKCNQQDNSVDFHEAKNDDASPDIQQRDSTALLFGIWGLLTKLSLALAIGIAFPILDLVGLDTDNLAAQAPNESATMALIALYALIPIVLKVWVFLQMWQFPYGKSYFSDSSSAGTSNIKGNNNENTKTAIANRTNSFFSSVKRV